MKDVFKIYSYPHMRTEAKGCHILKIYFLDKGKEYVRLQEE